MAAVNISIIAWQKFNFNSIINGKILDWSKLKAFADDKITIAEIKISLSHRVENIEGKGKNAGYQHFLLFPQCFQKLLFQGPYKSGLCGRELIVITFLNKPLTLLQSLVIMNMWKKSLSKHCWKRKNMIATNIYSFHHTV